MAAMAPPALTDLAAVPLFAALRESDRAFLSKNLDELAFPEGQVLITEGKANHTFFVLRSGEVEVQLPGKPSRRLGAGDFFGEISMDQNVPATASVVTRTAVTAWVMSHHQFRAVRGNQELLLLLRTAMTQRLLDSR
jgi:CRP-like cAMP-binding protein